MNWNKHFVIDVESDGPHPLDYNMISFGIVCVGDPSKTFLGEVFPLHGNEGIKAARDISGVSFEEQLEFEHGNKVMPKAVEFLKSVHEGRVTFWSDNPAFDWQFWNAYVHRFTGANPAGFSARRIGDLAAGLRNQPLNTNAWKKMRRAPHDHNPVNDALGNVQALRRLLDL